jgi:hypothetical protein
MKAVVLHEYGSASKLKYEGKTLNQPPAKCSSPPLASTRSTG